MTLSFVPHVAWCKCGACLASREELRGRQAAFAEATAPRALSGYDPSRAFRTDFANKPGIIVPIRRAEIVRSNGRAASPVIAAVCSICDEPFTRHASRSCDFVAKGEPTCSVKCAAVRRWRNRSR